MTLSDDACMKLDPLEAIHHAEMFAGLAPEDRDVLGRGQRVAPFHRGKVLFLEGDNSDTYGIVLDGYLKLVKSSPTGKETIVELLGPGDVFGALVAMESRPYPVNVVALSEGSAAMLSGTALKELATMRPSLMHALLIALGPRLRQAQSMILRLVSGRVESRIASVLLLLARSSRYEDGRQVVGPSLTRQDIADLSGTTVETAIRTISAWQKQGLVTTTQNRQFVLLDPGRMERIAEYEG